MAGGKQTPRQAMIGMMYLVLLAMLAMNASKDLLNAFVSLDNGITKTVQSFEKANASYYTLIDKAAASSESYKEVQAKANKIKEKSREVVQMMANHKVRLFGGLSEEFMSVEDTVGSETYRALFENGIPLNKDNQQYLTKDFTEIVSNLSIIYQSTAEIALELDNIYGGGCHVAKGRIKQYNIFCRYSHDLMARIELENDIFIIAWRR